MCCVTLVSFRTWKGFAGNTSSVRNPGVCFCRLMSVFLGKLRFGSSKSCCALLLTGFSGAAFWNVLLCWGILVIFIRFHSRLQGLFVCIFNVNSCRDVLGFFSLSKESLISSFQHLVPNFLPLLWMHKTFLKLWFVINSWCELGFLRFLIHTSIINIYFVSLNGKWARLRGFLNFFFSSFHGK